MLLFSTILDLQDHVTPDDFIRLVLEWNAGSKYAHNRVTGIDWHGEHNVRYGEAGLWMEFVEHPEQGILAVRHEKITRDGVTWDSDFVMNYCEKRIAIQLDRTYSEDALVIDGAFSTPHFITLLIENGFIRDDADLPVLRTPIYVTDEYFDLCQRAFADDSPYKLPVVFVSKTAQNKDPLSVSWLASRLKGAAHVLVEQSIDQCAGIRRLGGKSDVPFGAVRIFYPSGTVKRKNYYYRSATGDERIRLEKVIRSVIQYSISQRIDRLYTWNGVTGFLLNEQLKSQIESRMKAETEKQKAETEKQKAEDEVEKVYEAFDEDLQSLQEKVAELTKANEALQYENQGLRAKYAAADATPVLFLGDEEDFYQGEIRDMILGTLNEALSATEKATRKADVLEDILENNTYYHLSEERKQRVKALFKGYKNLTGAMRQELMSLGFEVTEAGKHYKITYRGDQRYMVTVGKTPSDNRSGSNNAALISKVML